MAWYKTLSERYAGVIIDATIYTTRPELMMLVTALIPGPTTRILIPRWTSTIPYILEEEYTLTRSSRERSSSALFLAPYDPIVVYNKRDKLIGVLSTEGFAARKFDINQDELPSDSFVIDELELMLKDPISYFESVGKRYGKCLICGRPLKTEESLERAIGPVCYKHVMDAREYARNAIYEDVSELAEVRTGHHGIAELSDRSKKILSSEELTGLTTFNTLLYKYYRSGFHINPIGLLEFDTHTNYPAYRLDLPAAKDKIVHLRPVDSSQYTGLTASILRGGVDEIWFDKSTVSICMYASEYNKSNLMNDIQKTPTIPPLVRSSSLKTIRNEAVVENRALETFQENNETDSLPAPLNLEVVPRTISTKSQAFFEWSDDHSNMLLYRFPPAIMSQLRKVPGAEYNKNLKRMVIPASQRIVVEDIVTLVELP